MKILYLGDVMGLAGIETVEALLPGIVSEYSIDVVVAQSENVSDGKGLTIADYERLKKSGVHGFTSGNHTVSRSETALLLNDDKSPVTRPANYPDGVAVGPKFKILVTQNGRVLLISLLGSIVGKHSNDPMDNPLKVVDQILASLTDQSFDAILVNFHGDFSSEKIVIGHYLDGRVSAVIGDHWHVPTHDARVLPGGTAHITDVGMCGALNSSLGVKYDAIIARWRDGIPVPNELETLGPRQLNGLLIEVNPETNKAKSIKQIQKFID